MVLRLPPILVSVALLVGLGGGGRGAGAPPAAKLVTLQAEKVLLSKALDELARQTGVRVEDRRGEPDRDVRVDLKGVTFWQALDRIAEAAGARVYLYPRSGRITLVPRRPDAPAPRVSYDGPFRTAITKVMTAHDLETGAHTCKVVLEVAWEPQLQPFYLETRPQGLVVRDEGNRPVAVPEPGSSQAPVDGRISLAFEVALPAPPRTAAKIGLIEGHFSAIGPSKMLTFTFDTLDRLHAAAADGPSRKLTQEGVTCRVRKVVLAEDRWTVQVALDYPPGNKDLESYQSWVVNNEMVLVSADGKRRLPSSSYVIDSMSARRAVIAYNFVDKGRLRRGKPGDWKLAYRAPASVIEMPLTFSFKDVPLP